MPHSFHTSDGVRIACHGTDNYAIMRAQIPDMKLTTYERSPHNICDISPECCAADVLAFLNQPFGRE